MPLSERLKRAAQGERADSSATTGPTASREPEIYHKLKQELHNKLIDKLDLKTVENRQVMALGDRAVCVARLRDVLDQQLAAIRQSATKANNG